MLRPASARHPDQQNGQLIEREEEAEWEQRAGRGLPVAALVVDVHLATLAGGKAQRTAILRGGS
jgi:hypothetical protein